MGFGHLTRCCALAKVLKDRGHGCVGYGPPDDVLDSDQRELFSGWIARDTDLSPEMDAQQIVDLAQKRGVGMLIVDDYRISELFQKRFRAAKLRWLQFDGGAARPIWANFVVNAHPTIHPRDYEVVLQDRSTTMLLGPRFAVMRPEFASVKKGDLNRRTKRILITFGGGDDRGGIDFVLRTLLPALPEYIEFAVISGSANPRNAYLHSWAERFGSARVRVYVAPGNVASLIASCDIAVMAGGSSLYEVACCGLPMIIISVAQNQVAQSVGWEKIGASLYVGGIHENIRQKFLGLVQGLLDDPDKLREMRRVGLEQVDGLGVFRVADALGA